MTPFFAPLDRQNVQEEARQPAHRSRLGAACAAAVLDAHVGDLRVATRCRAGWRGVDLAREAQHVDVGLTPICFSPAISRWPLGSTSVTVAVMVPVKSLCSRCCPCRKGSLVPAALGARQPAVRRTRGSGDAGASISPLLAPMLSGALLAGARPSTICTVSVSPTRRARRSSNSGRYWRGLEDRADGGHHRRPPVGATGSGSVGRQPATRPTRQAPGARQPPAERERGRIGGQAREARPCIRVAQALQHLVGGLDRLGVQLVGALRLDHATSSSTTLTLLVSTKPWLARRCRCPARAGGAPGRRSRRTGSGPAAPGRPG